MLQRAKETLRTIHLHLQRDEDVIPHNINIFPLSLYDGHGREIPLLLFGERALIP